MNFREKHIASDIADLLETNYNTVVDALCKLGFSYTDEDYNDNRPVNITELADCVGEYLGLWR